MEPVKVIFLKIPPEDFILAARAAKWLLSHAENKHGILSYGEGERTFWVQRNKASVTVRPC